MSSIQAPRLTWQEIRAKAEEFRIEYVSPIDSLPVPIIEVVELKLKLNPIPILGLMQEIDIDGFLTKDLKSICIDQDLYENPRRENRLRFTFAHEVGHFVLHKKEIQVCRFRTARDWMRFREDFDEEELNWFELQAYEFAGRLLVPRDKLAQDVEALAPRIKEYQRRAGNSGELVVQAISRTICKNYLVSAEVVARRIKIEQIGF